MSDAPNTDANSRFIAELGEKAAGTLDIMSLTAPEGAYGIPPSIEIAYRSGKDPQFIDLAKHFEPWRTGPERRTGTAKTGTLQSFIDLVNRHKDEDSVIFASTQWPSPKLTAVIDYHKQDKTTRFGRHRIEYAFPISKELSQWIEMDGKPMEQLDFARFLEDHAAELASPTHDEKIDFETKFKERFSTPNELIDLSRSLEVFVGCKIKRTERLKDGDRSVQFERTTTDGNGDPIDIPGIFMISLPAFVDGQPIRIPARLRFRAQGAEVKWHYNLYRWQEWLRLRVQEDLAQASAATGLPAFEGAPEAA